MLTSQEKKVSLLEKDHASYEDATKKWLSYRMKVESAASIHNTVTSNLQELLNKERKLRLDMEEVLWYFEKKNLSCEITHRVTIKIKIPGQSVH